MTEFVMTDSGDVRAMPELRFSVSTPWLTENFAFCTASGSTSWGCSLSLAQASAGMTPDDLPTHPVPARIR